MSGRRNFYVNRGFQSRFALELTAIVLLVPVAFWVNYFIIGQYTLIDQMGKPHEELSAGVISGMLSTQWDMVILLYIINVAIVAFLVMRYSHRVAGPVYRYERILSGITIGSKKICLKLRPGDYFPEVAQGIEKLCNTVEEDLNELENVADSLSGHSDGAVKRHAETMKSVMQRVHFDS